MMDNWLQDLRIAARRMAARPLFFPAASGVLAPAIFSVVDGVLLESLPFQEPDSKDPGKAGR